MKTKKINKCNKIKEIIRKLKVNIKDWHVPWLNTKKMYMYKDADVWAKWWKALILIYGKRKTHHPEIADPGHIVSIERERNTHIQRFLIFTFLMSYIPRMIFWSSRHSFVDLESVSLCLSISLSPFLIVNSSSILLAITIYR